MPITFEECYLCGKNEMRKEGELHYNQSQDVFYYVWRCYNCKDATYTDVEPKDMENPESKKAICLLCQNWNRKAVEYNDKYDLYKIKINTK